LKPTPFAYSDPRSVDETIALLGRHGEDAKILAGGQSLVPMLNFRLARPAMIVDINRVAGLDTLAEAGGSLKLGALVRQRRLERWARERAPLLAAALALVGHAAIRNRGTVAGSLVHADPAAELPALLVALDGVAVARSSRGERRIAAAELFRGPLVSSVAPDELVVETELALPAPGEGWGLHEVARRHGDFALAGAVAVVGLRQGKIARPRVVVFGVAPTALRLTDAERALSGQPPAADVFRKIAEDACRALDAPDDIHATAGYRRRVSATLVARALTDAVSRARDDVR
jgi:aerobic carbon-monoxide dehydrogenase medium subunit